MVNTVMSQSLAMASINKRVSSGPRAKEFQIKYQGNSAVTSMVMKVNCQNPMSA